MQAQPSTPIHRARPKPLKLVAPIVDKKEVAWSGFKYELTRLLHANANDAVSYEATLLVWYAVEKSYRALREAWTGPSKKERRRKHDPDLESWRKGRDAFLDHVWGVKGDDGKRHGSADPAVAKVMTAYQKQWNVWRKRSADYAVYKKGENKRRNKLAHVIAKKKAWASSEAGLAWRTKRNADNRAARAEAKKAKQMIVEVLRDV